MTAATATTKLNIDASAALRGKRQFVGAIAAIKAAMAGLSRDTDGLFQKLNATTKAAAPKNVEAQFTAINGAVRSAEKSLGVLHRSLNKTGNIAGLRKVDSAMEQFRRETAATELTTEELRAAQDRLAQSFHEVRQEVSSANEVQRLRTQYQRMTAAVDEASTAYHPFRRHVQSVEQAHRAGAISTAQMNHSLELAKKAYLGAGNEAKVAAAKSSRFFGTLAGWGQGGARNVLMQLNQVAQQASVTGNVLGAMSTQAFDIGLGFGPWGIILGGAAGMLGGVFASALSEGKEKTDALSDSLSRLESTTQAMSVDSLVSKYGVATKAVKDLTKAQAELALFDASEALKSAQEELIGDTFWDTYADNAGGRVMKLRNTLQLTIGDASKLYDELENSLSAETPNEAADAYERARNILLKVAGSTKDMTAEQRAFYGQILQTEDAQRRVADLTSDVTGQTEVWAARMANVKSQIDAIKGALSTIGGGILGNAAKEAELRALSEGKSVRDAANAATRYQKEAEWKARSQGGNWLDQQLIKMERFQFERGLALDAQLDAARSSTRTSGGGRAQMTSAIERSVTALERENAALLAQAQGLVTSDRAAQLYAEAIAKGGGEIDANTLSVIQHADHLEQLNDKLRESADLSKNGIGAKIGSDLERGIAGALKGGSIKDSVKQLGRALRNTIADSAAKKTVHTLGIDRLFDVGGLTAAAQMQAGIIQGSAQGASMMAQAIATGQASGAAASAVGGGGGGFFKTALSFVGSMFGLPFFSEGGYSDAPMPFQVQKLPHYAEGTANTSNGIPAVLHPNEAVVPLSRGRKIPVEIKGGAGGKSITMGDVHINVESNGEDDAGLAVKIAQRFEETVEGIVETKIAENAKYGGILNPRGGM